MVEKLYKEGLSKLIMESIDFNKYDKKLSEANLFIVPSKNIEKNLNSEYYSLLNYIHIDRLNENDSQIIANKEIMDNEVLEIVKRTYKDVLKKGDFDYTMYNPPMPSHRVPNGSIVLEMVIGKSNCNYNATDYIKLRNKQSNFINNINKEISDKISNDFSVPCAIFFDKRV